MLRIHLLGAFHLEHAGAPVRFAARPRALPLLAYLLLHRQRPVDRETLAFTLWPDAREAEARANLRRHLYQLQRALPPAPPDRAWLLIDTDTVRWNPAAAWWLDLAQFEVECERPGGEAAAAGLYAGDLLPGLEDEWLAPERDRLRRRYAAVVLRLIEAAQAAADHRGALHWAERLLAHDPLREDVVRTVMALHQAAGNRAGGLLAYRAFARRLRDDLGVEPMPETVALAGAIARGAPQRPPPATSTSPPLVNHAAMPFTGRLRELTALHRAWLAAVGGGGGAVFLGGEAGVGKTRLVGELARRVEAGGGHVLLGSTAFAEPLPYQAFVQALNAVAPWLAALDPRPAWLAGLARLLPNLPVRPAAAAHSASADARERLFQAVGECLETLARARPVLLVLEDMHWAGSATVALVEALARRATRCRCLLVVTYRGEEAPRVHPLRELRRRLRGAGVGREIVLDRLSADEVGRLVGRLSGLGPAAASLAATLHAASEGNPLFLGELIRDRLEAGVIAVERGRWRLAEGPPTRSDALPLPPPTGPVQRSLPGGVEATIRARLGRLSPAARRLAQAAAMVGPAFDIEIVREVLGWAETATLDALGELLDRHLVREVVEPGSSDFVFTHHLIQAAIYHAVPEACRPRRHRRIAIVLEELRPAQRDDLAGLLAAHFDHGGDPARAATYYTRAARRALAVFADAEALTAIDRGLHLAMDAPARFDLLALRETVHDRAADRAAQRADLAAMAELAPQLDDERACDALLRQAQLHRFLGEREAQGAVIRALNERAASTGRQDWQAAAGHAEAFLHFLHSRYVEAAAAAHRAYTLYRAAGLAAEAAACSACLAESLTKLGRFGAAARWIDLAAPPAAETERSPAALLWLEAATLHALYGQRHAVAHERAARLHRVALAVGQRQAVALALMLLAQAAHGLFHVDAAARHFAEAAAIYASIGNRRGTALVEVHAAYLALHLGRHAEALPALDEAAARFRVLAEPDMEAFAAARLAQALRESGEPARAAAAAQCALELAEAIGSPILRAVALGQRGAARLALAEPGAAVADLRAATDGHRELGRHVSLVEDLRPLALAYLALGDVGAARSAIDEALALHAAEPDQSPQPHQTLWVAATVDRAQGDLGAAARREAEARTLLRARADALADAHARQTYLAHPAHLPLICPVDVARTR